MKRLLFIVALVCAFSAYGQPQTQATVGVPFTLDIGQGLVQQIEGLIGALPEGFSF